MDHTESGAIDGLPENARRPLKPGEVYVPVVPDESGVYEVTARSVTLGLIFRGSKLRSRLQSSPSACRRCLRARARFWRT